MICKNCGAPIYQRDDGVWFHSEWFDRWCHGVPRPVAEPESAPIYPQEICGDMNGPNGVVGECVMPAGHQHRDGIGGEWPLEEK